MKVTRISSISLAPNGGISFSTVNEFYEGGELVGASQPHMTSITAGEDLAGMPAEIRALAAVHWTPEVLQTANAAKAKAAARLQEMEAQYLAERAQLETSLVEKQALAAQAEAMRAQAEAALKAAQDASAAAIMAQVQAASDVAQVEKVELAQLRAKRKAELELEISRAREKLEALG